MGVAGPAGARTRREQQTGGTALREEYVGVSGEESPRDLTDVQGVLDEDPQVRPTLSSPGGKQAPLPASLTQVLRQAAQMLRQGHIVLLAPLEHELTTNQAADILNVSRPYLLGLLDSGEIPSSMVGAHRKVQFSALMEYKVRRDAERLRGIERLADLGHELGMYA